MSFQRLPVLRLLMLPMGMAVSLSYFLADGFLPERVSKSRRGNIKFLYVNSSCARRSFFSSKIRNASLVLSLLTSMSYPNPIVTLYDIALSKENVDIICNMNVGIVRGAFTFSTYGTTGYSGKEKDIPSEFRRGILVPVYFTKDTCRESKNADQIIGDTSTFKAEFMNLNVRPRLSSGPNDISLTTPGSLGILWYEIDILSLDILKYKATMGRDDKYIANKTGTAVASEGGDIDLQVYYRQSMYVDSSQTRFIYTPIIPHMSKQENYSITLRCPSNLRLSLVTKNQITASSDTSITVAPRHLEAIIVSVSDKESKKSPGFH